ncbi:hypothetical protein FCIRC_2257 [Fusarium circinatum]|uniref:Uncharacterized protein n=1 Tax=Fusarium circinatum TaxID=48490 RepID=A0A8H5UE73_FUSCI|nr:hypothetical protein FCIRC_2257 [Fusarium circinatum]
MSLTKRKNKSQKVGLLDLPNELLFSIIEHEKMCWRDHLSIHQVSSRLFQLTFKHVYDGERDIFLHACSFANLDLMIECLKHRNVPTSHVWHQHEWCLTPLDILSFAFQDGDCSSGQYIKVAGWLFDNGYKTDQIVSSKDEMITSRVVSPLLLTMFSTATDTDDHRGICQAIEFLTSKGLGFPGSSQMLKRVSHRKMGDRRSGYRSFARDSGSDMEMILQSAFPPALFDLFLKNLFSDFGLTLQSRLAPNHLRDDVSPCEQTRLNDLVRILFDDLFAPWIYKGDSPSYFSDTFEAKIKLLVENDGIAAYEQPALESILEALRRIEARQRDNNGSLNFERDGTWCWRELCVSISQTLVPDDRQYWIRHSLEDPPREIHFGVERRVHEFVRPRSWYPPDDLIAVRSTLLGRPLLGDAHDKLDPSWLEDRTQQDWVNMPLDAWNFIRLQGGSGGSRRRIVRRRLN